MSAGMAYEALNNAGTLRSRMVVVEDTIYKGASVAFGDIEYKAPDRGERQTILRINDRGLVNEGYNRAEPPELWFEQPPDAE
jgi:hypothetical protein